MTKIITVNQKSFRPSFTRKIVGEHGTTGKVPISILPSEMIYLNAICVQYVRQPTLDSKRVSSVICPTEIM